MCNLDCRVPEDPENTREPATQCIMHTDSRGLKDIKSVLNVFSTPPKLHHRIIPTAVMAFNKRRPMRLESICSWPFLCHQSAQLRLQHAALNPEGIAQWTAGTPCHTSRTRTLLIQSWSMHGDLVMSNVSTRIKELPEEFRGRNTG